MATRGDAPAGPVMGSMVAPQEERPTPPVLADLVRGAYEQLADQSRRFPTSYGTPEADAAAMSPETYVNPLAKGIVGSFGHAMGSLATLPKRAIESAANYRASGEYDPGPILEAAMLPMGVGAAAGVPVRAREAVLGAGAVRLDRYKQALAEGRITPQEYQGFAEALSSSRPDVGAAIDALSKERGIAYIGDLMGKTGMSKEELHSALLDAAKTGDVTIHPTTSEWVNLSKTNQDAAMRVPGHPDPLVHVVRKR